MVKGPCKRPFYTLLAQFRNLLNIKKSITRDNYESVCVSAIILLFILPLRFVCSWRWIELQKRPYSQNSAQNGMPLFERVRNRDKIRQHDRWTGTERTGHIKRSHRSCYAARATPSSTYRQLPYPLRQQSRSVVAVLWSIEDRVIECLGQEGGCMSPSPKVRGRF